MEHVKFIAMKDGDKADCDFLTAQDIEHAKGAADRLLRALVELDDVLSGYQVTRLGHSLQSATRAWRDGADVDWIVAALLHDIGDIFAPYNHDEYAASILRPFVREQCAWCVEVHGEFQQLYYGEYTGADPNKRDQHRANPYFEDCAAFCERWDQSSFDPQYPNLPVAFFAPMVREMFARNAYSPSVIRVGAREPLVDKAIAATRAAA
ncbi:MAG: HD domain-containing protein [Pseudomonadota bacterium]